MTSKLFWAGLLGAVVAGAVWFANGPVAQEAPPQDTGAGGMVAVVVPPLSAAAQDGAQLFAANCIQCHGADGAGVEGSGPPLIHKIYEPSHHGDISFLRAVQYGVRAHHWRFGDMPAVAGVSVQQTGQIITYLREVQRANGIE